MTKDEVNRIILLTRSINDAYIISNQSQQKDISWKKVRALGLERCQKNNDAYGVAYILLLIIIVFLFIWYNTPYGNMQHAFYTKHFFWCCIERFLIDTTNIHLLYITFFVWFIDVGSLIDMGIINSRLFHHFMLL